MLRTTPKVPESNELLSLSTYNPIHLTMPSNLKFFLENKLRYNFYFRRTLKKVIRQADLSNDALKSEQNALFLEVVRQAYRRSSFYRQLYDAHGVDVMKLGGTEDIHHLPIITKQDIRENRRDIFVGNPLNRTKGYTSGTTGSPLVVYRDYQSMVKEWAYQWAYQMQHSYKIGMKTVILRGNLGKTKMESLDPYSNTLYLSSYNLSKDNAEWYYERIRDFAPHTILAYPSALEMLASYFQGIKKSLRIPLAFTSSESLYDHQREKIEAVFSTQIWDWYGNAERTIALQQNTAGRYDEIPLYSVNEFHEDHAITTGLINFSFPLIRYKVEDVFVMADTQKAGFRTIERIQGRKYDFVLLPDGTRVVSFGRALKGINNLLFTQIVQKEIGSFLVNIVTDPHFTPRDEERIRQNIVELVGNQAVFDIVRISEEGIIRSGSGKFKLVLNQIDEEKLLALA